MVFKGTRKISSSELRKRIKALGGYSNATTGLDSTNYFITVPSENQKSAYRLIKDIVFNPLFDKNELEKEREVILEEIRLGKDDPSRQVMRELWRLAYLEHPYKIPVIGYEELLKDLRHDDILDYHSSRYIPSNIILTIAGDVDTTKTLSYIESDFADLKRKRNPDRAVPLEPEQNSIREYKGFSKINLGYISLGYHTVEATNQDLYALDVLSIVLGSGDGSRLNRKLVKDESLLYAVASFNHTPKFPGLFIVYGIGDYENLEASRDAALSEIENIKNASLSEDELTTAKNLVISSYIDSLETTGGVAGQIAQGEFYAGDPLFFKNYVDGIQKVNKNTVEAVAKKYLRPDNLTISYLYPEYADDGKDLAPNAKVKIQPTIETLPNGIKLIMKEDHRFPKVSLVCAFLGGVRVETKENNGISNLTGKMLLKGTKKRTEDMIKPQMEKYGGNISHFSGRNSLGFSLGFLSDNTEESLDILEDAIKNPTFPEEELEKEKKKLYAAIKAEDDDIYDTAFLKLEKKLFQNYPYGFRIIGEKDSLETLTKKDLKKFWRKFGTASNLVVSVVGDFDSKLMRDEIKRRFSGMNKKKNIITSEKPKPLLGENTVKHTMEREQSLVLVGFRGATIKSYDKYYLQVLCSILSGSSGRLYDAIRDKFGLSYALGTFQVTGIDAGFVISYVATDKKKLKDAHDILLKEFKKIQKGDISEEEIMLAKAELIGSHKISLQKYQSFSYQMALDELYGTGYDNYKKYPEYIKNIKKEDLVSVARKYLNFDSFVIVEVIGEEK